MTIYVVLFLLTMPIFRHGLLPCVDFLSSRSIINNNTTFPCAISNCCGVFSFGYCCLVVPEECDRLFVDNKEDNKDRIRPICESYHAVQCRGTTPRRIRCSRSRTMNYVAMTLAMAIVSVRGKKKG